MKKRTTVDLVVIGAEPAGYAAAACAARFGASVILLKTGHRTTRSPSSPGIPDFVWRKLNLQNSGLEAKPVSARVSLFEGGRTISTFENRKRTRDALEKAHVADHHLLPDFEDALDRLWSEGAELARASSSGKSNGKGPLLAAIGGPNGADAARRLTASTSSILEDYFSDDELKAHFASIALAPFGLGGDEPGSGLALAAMSEPAAWRVRTGAKGPSLARVLENAALEAGVEVLEARVKEIQRGDQKSRTLVLDNGDTVRTSHFMASSLEAAARADLEVASSFTPLARRDGAVADIRVRFQKTPQPPTAGKDAVYYLADSLASIADARDAAAEGRLAERMPISFEFNREEIVVHAPYCPAYLRVEDEVRDWSEQDRQAFGMLIVSRLDSCLNGATGAVRRVEVRVSQTVASPADDRSSAVLAPPPGHDPIGAAALLALELVGGR